VSAKQPASGRAVTDKLPRDVRREQTLRAAREVFIERGSARARTRDIAERAGITESHLFRHFTSKDEIYALAVEKPLVAAFDELVDDVHALAERSGNDQLAFIRGFNERSLAFFTDHGALAGIALFSDLSLGRRLYRESIRGRLEEMRGVLAENSGWNRPGMDEEVVRRAVFGASWAIAYAYLLRGERIDVRAVAENLTRIQTVGVREQRHPERRSGPADSS
jgi:TetR/AcrR family transcriptional regulator